jgi:undecaprenyl diphosphate synthase
MEKKNKTKKTHVVIIPDGNRRWAKRKGLRSWDGHEAGAKIMEELIRVAFDKGIDCLSIWGSSVDNLLKRPVREKIALLKIYETYFQKLLQEKDIYENEVRVNIIGRWEEQFPQSLKKLLQRVIDKTKHYKKNMLNFMLAYGGTDDMLQAFEKVNNKYKAGKTITAKIVKENLMTALLPPVDFMIRTGGEPHNSNGFLMWDSANAQLKFSSELFPDFNGKKLIEALDEYAQRKRRFGK